MFIRKKKILNEIDEMIEDHEYWIEHFESKGKRELVLNFKCAKVELENLAYFIVHNKRWGKLMKRSEKND